MQLGPVLPTSTLGGQGHYVWGCSSMHKNIINTITSKCMKGIHSHWVEVLKMIYNELIIFWVTQVKDRSGHHMTQSMSEVPLSAEIPSPFLWSQSHTGKFQVPHIKLSVCHLLDNVTTL